MWLFLNVTSLMALGRVSNEPKLTARHQAFFALEGAGLGLFAVLNTLYFGLRCPVLGAVDTAAGLLIGLRSVGQG